MGLGEVDEPPLIRRWRDTVAREGEVHSMDRRTLAVASPPLAREILAHRSGHFRDFGLLGDGDINLLDVRRALRRWAVDVDADLTQADVHRKMMLRIAQGTAPDAMALAAVDVFAPYVFGDIDEVVAQLAAKFVMSRVYAGDRRLAARLSRRIARNRLLAAIAKMIHERRHGRTPARSDSNRPVALDYLLEASPRLDPLRLSRLAASSLLAVTGTPGFAAAWLMYESVRPEGLISTHPDGCCPPDARIKELLRLRPPAWLEQRTVTASCVVAGRALRPDDRLIVPVLLVQTHPDHWSEPLRYDPHRWSPDGPTPPYYLPFGHGPRSCLGTSLAYRLLRDALALAPSLRSTGHSGTPRTSPLYGPPDFTLAADTTVG